MRRWKFVVLLALLAVASLSLAVPKVLIIQSSPNSQTDNGPVLLGDALAQALEEDGKLDPIVWSDSDPVFRAALLDGRIRTGTGAPSPDDIQAAAKALGCDYVMMLKVEMKGTTLSGKIDCLKGAQPLWSDSQVMDPGRSSSSDLDNVVRSVARTWAIKLSAGPLRSLHSEPLPPETPAPAQGQAPRISTTPDPIAQQPDSAKALAEYQRLMTSKQVAQATTTLREAIDASPLDPKLRIAFVQHLTQIGRKAEAAAEATRASLLIPESQELRALAAQAFIDTGQSTEAEAQLNEALARDPDDVPTRTMVADIDLNALKPQAALEHIDAAMKKAPSKDLAYRRALADALLGDSASVGTDLSQAAQLSWTGTDEQTYARCMKVMDSACDRQIGDLRSLVQRAAVKRDDPDVAKAIDDQIALIQARQALVAGWSPPLAHKLSHGKRVLALNLLSEFLSGLKAYLSDGSEDTLSDANINLGEAIKQFTSARDALATEQGSIAKEWKHSPTYLSLTERYSRSF